MIEIKEVVTDKDLKKFIRFVNELYAGCPQWVPALEFDELNTLRKDKNPAFEHSKARYWLAYKDGRIVGRIAGIINYAANQKWGDKVRFGWFDFTDDIEVARLLLETVEQWGKANGMTGIHGPLGFNDMDKEGMLVEGFDKVPTIATLYNYPYYPKFLEHLGYSKAEDWLQYRITVGNAVPDKIVRINNIIAQKNNDLRVLHFKKKSEIRKYAHDLFITLNASFADLYGYSQLTDREIEVIIGNYFSFVNPKYVSIIVDSQDKVVAFGISMPNLSAAYQKAKGKLFPFGFIHLLKGLKNKDTIDLYLNGVHPDWQKRGIHSLFFTQLNQAYIDNHFGYALTNPQLETNINAVGIWDNYEKELHMRRRCYVKAID